MKLKTINLKQLRNEEVEGFCDGMIALINNKGTIDDKKFLPPFENAVVAFRNNMHSINNSYGEAVRQADALADQAWRCINSTLKLNMNHYDENIREASTAVYKVFSTYDDPTNLPYIEEYARMDHIIISLEELPKELLQFAMIDGWLEELKSRCDNFKTCLREKQSANSNKATGAVLTSREELYVAWERFRTKIESMCNLYEDEAHDTLAKNINTLIEERVRAIKTRKTLKNKPEETEGNA